jgi:hypothetical protein
MSDGIGRPRMTASTILASRARFTVAALTISTGFSYVLEAEDQFKRATWFGLLFAALTGAWFIVGSFLAAVDTVGVWAMTALIGAASFALWGIGLSVTQPAWLDDVGDVDEPLTRLRLVLAVLVLVGATIVLVRASRAKTVDQGRGPAAARLGGMAVLVVGILIVVLTAKAQAYFEQEGDGGISQPPTAVRFSLR